MAFIDFSASVPAGLSYCVFSTPHDSIDHVKHITDGGFVKGGV